MTFNKEQNFNEKIPTNTVKKIALILYAQRYDSFLLLICNAQLHELHLNLTLTRDFTNKTKVEMCTYHGSARIPVFSQISKML